MDFPEEAIPLIRPAGAGLAPFLLSLAFDLAKDAVLVAEAEEVIGGEEIHDLPIFKPANRIKQGKTRPKAIKAKHAKKQWRPQGDLTA
jgi:hypothetical protein